MANLELSKESTACVYGQFNNDTHVYDKINGEWQMGDEDAKKRVKYDYSRKAPITAVSDKKFKNVSLGKVPILDKEILNAGAGAGLNNTKASASKSGTRASAEAAASWAEACAHAKVLEGLVDAKATASVYKASSHAEADWNWKNPNARAGAEANVAKAAAGVENTPLQAHVVLAGADAEAAISWKYAGASAGAYLGEARAGPFAARAGVKFGAGVRNGVPEVDMGPVTVPCCVM